jgi:hypothetical protein
MFFNGRLPIIGDIIVVPLAQPTGLYILVGGSKVPVLAKVRSIFADTVNVVNYFGHIYNVPLKHIQFVDKSLRTQYYVNMVNNAHNILNRLGIRAKDNKEFYKEPQNIVKYAFMSLLPIRPNIIIPNNPLYNVYTPYKTKYNYYDNDDDDDVIDEYDSTEGNIKVIDYRNIGVIHLIENTENVIIYDNKRKLLYIKNYGVFHCSKKHIYQKDNTGKKYIIYKSHNNFIHIKKSDVKEEKIKDINKENNIDYNIKLIKVKKHDHEHI